MYSPDGQFVMTASFDSTARIWDAETGQELVALVGHEGRVCSTMCSADGQKIVSGSDGRHSHSLEYR